MLRQHAEFKLTDTLFPYPTLFRSMGAAPPVAAHRHRQLAARNEGGAAIVPLGQLRMLGRDQPGFACRMDVDHLRFPAEPCRLGRGGFDRAPAAGDEAVVGVPFRRLVRLYRFAPARARRGYPVSEIGRASCRDTVCTYV